MKIALCLSGYFGKTSNTSDAIAGYSYIKKKLLSKYDVDVFIHSWDLSKEQEVEDLYKPVGKKFELQKDFFDQLSRLNENDFFGEKGQYYHNSMFKTFSVSYSRKESVLLKKQHEMQNNFIYDCVIMTRFDLGQRGKEHPQKYYATNFNFNQNLNMDYIYSAYWDQLNHGFADHWFFSNSKNMDIVSCLHDKLDKYYTAESEYIQKVTKGWPDSNAANQFSNEFYSSTEPNKLKTWNVNACIDNHKLYKWYFIDSGLYDMCKFVDITEDR